MRRRPLGFQEPEDSGIELREQAERLLEEHRRLLRRLLDPTLTLHEASLLLGVSQSTIRRLTNVGRLPCIRTPGGQRRFRLSDLLRYLASRDPAVRRQRDRLRALAQELLQLLEE